MLGANTKPAEKLSDFSGLRSLAPNARADGSRTGSVPTLTTWLALNAPATALNSCCCNEGRPKAGAGCGTRCQCVDDPRAGREFPGRGIPEIIVVVISKRGGKLQALRRAELQIDEARVCRPSLIDRRARTEASEPICAQAREGDFAARRNGAQGFGHC